MKCLKNVNLILHWNENKFYLISSKVKEVLAAFICDVAFSESKSWAQHSGLWVWAVNELL